MRKCQEEPMLKDPGPECTEETVQTEMNILECNIHSHMKMVPIKSLIYRTIQIFSTGHLHIVGQCIYTSAN